MLSRTVATVLTGLSFGFVAAIAVVPSRDGPAGMSESAVYLPLLGAIFAGALFALVVSILKDEPRSRAGR